MSDTLFILFLWVSACVGVCVFFYHTFVLYFVLLLCVHVHAYTSVQKRDWSVWFCRESLYYKIWITDFTFITCADIFCAHLAHFQMHGFMCTVLYVAMCKMGVCCVLACVGVIKLWGTLIHRTVGHKHAAEQVASSRWHAWRGWRDERWRDGENTGRDAQCSGHCD